MELGKPNQQTKGHMALFNLIFLSFFLISFSFFLSLSILYSFFFFLSFALLLFLLLCFLGLMFLYVSLSVFFFEFECVCVCVFNFGCCKVFNGCFELKSEIWSSSDNHSRLNVMIKNSEKNLKMEDSRM